MYIKGTRLPPCKFLGIKRCHDSKVTQFTPTLFNTVEPNRGAFNLPSVWVGSIDVRDR